MALNPVLLKLVEQSAANSEVEYLREKVAGAYMDKLLHESKLKEAKTAAKLARLERRVLWGKGYEIEEGLRADLKVAKADLNVSRAELPFVVSSRTHRDLYSELRDTEAAKAA